MTKKHKKAVIHQWGLWNYNNLFGVEPTRKRAKELAATIFCGGKEEADRAFKDGSFHVSKVVVREL